jgi:chromosome segregation ATPase
MTTPRSIEETERALSKLRGIASGFDKLRYRVEGLPESVAEAVDLIAAERDSLLVRLGELVVERDALRAERDQSRTHAARLQRRLDQDTDRASLAGQAAHERMLLEQTQDKLRKAMDALARAKEKRRQAHVFDEELKARITRLEEALREIVQHDGTDAAGILDEWSQAGAFEQVQDIARNALSQDTQEGQNR